MTETKIPIEWRRGQDGMEPVRFTDRIGNMQPFCELLHLIRKEEKSNEDRGVADRASVRTN